MKNRRTSMVGWSLKYLIPLAAILVLGRLIPSDYVYSLLSRAAIYAIFASGVGVLLRQNGMVSFGHAAFFGLSGYALAIMFRDTGLSAEMALLVFFVGLTILSLALGWVMVRVSGIAFAMLTLAFGQLFYQVALQSRRMTGGADGIVVSWPDTLFGIDVMSILTPANFFTLAWCALLLTLLVLDVLNKSRFGLTTEAIRDNPERAEFIGIRPTQPKVIIFAISALLVGMGGVLSVLDGRFISPESMHWSVSGEVLMMVVVGGYSIVAGPAVGAVLFIIIKDLIGSFSTHWLSLFGLMLIVVVVFTNQGLIGLFMKLKPKPVMQARVPAGSEIIGEKK